MTPRPQKVAGLKRRLPCGLTVAQRAVQDGYASGLSPQEIEKKHGVRRRSVAVIASIHGWKRVINPVQPGRVAYAGHDSTETQWRP